MCARRFLILIVILILIVVAGAFALFQFGDQVLIGRRRPRAITRSRRKPAGPIIRADASWLAKPGLADDPSAWVPEGIVTTKAAQPAATFYIHPTTYLERDRWNAPLDAGGEAGDRARLFVQSQASAFNAVSDIWAPKYRQAAFGAFLLKSEDATQGARPGLSRRAGRVRRVPWRAARRQADHPRRSQPGFAASARAC